MSGAAIPARSDADLSGGRAAAAAPRENGRGLAPRRILAAMSGGVDSSVAATLLHRQGHEVVGATMKTFCYSGVEGPSNTCCGLEGIADARSVAHRVGFAHFVYDVEEEFTRDVIDDFVSEYAAGRTPIPCVRCNSFTKFRDMVRRADQLGCDGIATGHYARVRWRDGTPYLCRAGDDRKDQTYFLWGIPRAVLGRLHLPVGELEKPEVRRIARELELSTAEKPESFEICFVPDNDYAGVLRRYLGEDHPALSPGPFLLRDGSEVGRHDGYARFTVGQRKGLPGGFPRPMYVLEIRPEERAVVIGPRSALRSTSLVAGDVNWLVPDPPRPGEELGVRIRHGAPVVDARVAAVDAGSGERRTGGSGSGASRARSAPGYGASTDEPGPRIRLELYAEQRAVTPGQSAVLYREDVVVGGGVIRE